jgi:transcriptional regulator with XRE-family HTH domain
MNHSSESAIGQKIRQFREGAGLSQEQVAKQLGLNRVSYTQLEQGNRKVMADELVEIAKLFNTTPDVLLGVRKEKEIEVNLEGKPHPKKELEMRISVPQKNAERFRQALLYVLGKVGFQPNVGETVLYKLLYFIDFDYYEKFEEQLMGCTYIKNHHGPTPVEFKKIVDRMEANHEIRKETMEYFGHPQKKYLPLKQADLNLLTGREVQHIDAVLARLGHMNATEISAYSHGDIPWIATPEGQSIDYEAVFYRQSPYSVRSYNGEDAKAEQILADRIHFSISPGRWKAFVEALDRPAHAKPRLKRLFSETTVLESE